MFVEIFILIMNISISTAHNVDIDYIPAGVLDRILATLIDGAFQFGLLMLGLMFIGLFSMVASPTWFFVILAVIIASYHLFCEAVFNGRSLGKYTMRIQVVKLNGKKLTFWDCMLRWVFRLIDISISSGAVAVISIIASKRMQRLGDMAAGTTVIKLEKAVTLKQISEFEAPDIRSSFSKPLFCPTKTSRSSRMCYGKYTKTTITPYWPLSRKRLKK